MCEGGSRKDDKQAGETGYMCLRLASDPRLVAGSTPSLVCSRRSSQTGRW